MAQIDRYTCEETFRRLDDYLDRELSAEEMRLVQEHLEVCAFCVLEFAFEANVLREVRTKLRAIPAPPGLMSKVMGAIAQARNDPEGGSSGESEQPGN
jgi:anti-sigma factor (TIGR02949 family)